MIADFWALFWEAFRRQKGLREKDQTGEQLQTPRKFENPFKKRSYAIQTT
jgi:hypothetical protein